MTFDLDALVRNNVKEMKPYSTARHEFSGQGSIFLDANENAFGSPLPEIGGEAGSYNRYPDPLQRELKEKLSSIKGVPTQNMFLGSGSDEAIDLLFRIFCEPNRDNVLIFPPTYGMYEVCAAMNAVTTKKIPLKEDFQLDLPAIETAIDRYTKLIFVCSPNNPTGNSIKREDIEVLLNNFDGLVVVDEAYINYARQKSFIPELLEYPNLVILHTLSKAWGMAGLRIGMAFAAESIINYFNKIKYPYNINTASQQLAMKALGNVSTVNEWTRITTEEKQKLARSLPGLSFVEKVYPSEANFVLVKMKAPKEVYDFLAQKGIIVRDRSNVILCAGCLRITIGTPEENSRLMDALKEFKSKAS